VAGTVRVENRNVKLSAAAKKQWEKIPKSAHMKLLNNVYCGSCRKMTGIGNIRGSVDGGDLTLHGTCTACGSKVARLIETSELPEPA